MQFVTNTTTSPHRSINLNISIYVYILKLTYRTIGLAQTFRLCGRNQNGNERHQLQVRQIESAYRDFEYRFLFLFFVIFRFGFLYICII